MVLLFLPAAWDYLGLQVGDEHASEAGSLQRFSPRQMLAVFVRPRQKPHDTKGEQKLFSSFRGTGLLS